MDSFNFFPFLFPIDFHLNLCSEVYFYIWRGLMSAHEYYSTCFYIQLALNFSIYFFYSTCIRWYHYFISVRRQESWLHINTRFNIFFQEVFFWDKTHYMIQDTKLVIIVPKIITMVSIYYPRVVSNNKTKK